MRTLWLINVVLMGVLSCQSCQSATTFSPDDQLTVEMVELGDRQVAAGAKNVEVARLRLTARAGGGGALVGSVAVVESFSGYHGSSRAFCNLKLRTESEFIDSFCYAVNLSAGETLYVISFHMSSLDGIRIIIPGETMELSLIGDVLSDASIGSKHLVMPAIGARGARDIAAANDKMCRSTPASWEVPAYWPYGHVITIVSPL